MSNFKPNHAGFREIGLSPEVRRVLRDVAEKGKAYAETIAPRETGEYAASFEVQDETVEWTGEHPGPRAAARLIATAPYSAAVEYGYKGRSDAESSSAHRVLGRTLDYLESEGKA